MAGGTTPPGWYAAEGDPAGTQRWWDGNQWVGEPQAIETPSVPDVPSMPEVGGSSMPDVSAPSVPDMPSMPEVGGSSMPSMPDLSAPAGSMPSMPGSFGTPQDGMPAAGGFPGAPPASMGAPVGMYPEASQATLGLVLAIVGFFCGITAPVGLWLGWKERGAIDAGRRDPKNRGQAVAAIVIGAITTAFLVIGIAFFVLIVAIGASTS